MGLPSGADVREFVRRSHVHYEVEPEETTGSPRPELVGVRLRIFARHEREKLAAPGCQACVGLLEDLQALAELVAADAGVADRAETIPAIRKLYQSPDDRDADEVALTLRVRCEAPEHRRPGAGEDRCLAGVRERLAALGVARD
jgi:hypothetical protein